MRFSTIVGIFTALSIAIGYSSYSQVLLEQTGLRDEPFLSTVPCSEIVDTLKDFQDQVQTTSINSETGDTMNYLVVGNPQAREAILFIPGTSGTLPDWPVQLFTNSTSSPNLEREYPKAENSLCSEYALIFIDYPGVGGSQLGGTLSFENMSRDISQVLREVTGKHGIRIRQLHVLGWSLGSLAALKFATYNFDHTPIGTLFLSGSKPGGGADGNISGCVEEAFDLSETVDSILLEFTIFSLLFPYENQIPYNGESDACTGLNVLFQPNITFEPCEILGDCTSTPCTQEEMCGRTLDLFVDNRLSGSKWEGGVPNSVFIQERDLVASYDDCTCFPDNSSCTCESTASDVNPNDGGVCKCLQTDPNIAQCFSMSPGSGLGCADLSTTRNILVFNAKEDIFIQWLYGEYLVQGYNEIESGFAELINYDQDQGIQAGHGLPFQAPAWMQDKIYKKIKSSPPQRLLHNVPTLNEWGAMTMAVVLGIIGFMVIRRRKVRA